MCRFLRRGLVFVAVLLVIVSASAQLSWARGSWYYTVTPPLGGPTFIVGNYNSEYGCKDWLGSAMYSHPGACYYHPSANNCRITGNGYAYPEHWPFPTANIMSGTCFNSVRPMSQNRWWFFWYDSKGGSVIGGTSGGNSCEAMRQKYLRSNRPGDPGSGCFFMGNTRE